MDSLRGAGRDPWLGHAGSAQLHIEITKLVQWYSFEEVALHFERIQIISQCTAAGTVVTYV